jgi:predicted ABC-type ATPase
LGRVIRERICQQHDFAIETTFSSLTYAHSVRTWRKHGYRVELVFLGLAAPELSIARVGVRSQQGGHAVPDSEIRRRFAIGLQHFQNYFQATVDAWVWFDNSGAQPGLMATGGDLQRELLRAGALLALRRSGCVARQLARQTNTPVFVWQGGKPANERAGAPLENWRVA